MKANRRAGSSLLQVMAKPVRQSHVRLRGPHTNTHKNKTIIVSRIIKGSRNEIHHTRQAWQLALATCCRPRHIY